MNCSNDGSNFSLAQKGAENTDVIIKEVDKRNTKSSLNFTFIYIKKSYLTPFPPQFHGTFNMVFNI